VTSVGFLFRTKPRPRPDLRKSPTDLGPRLVCSAEARFRVEKHAVASMALLENEEAGRCMKAAYDAFLVEATKCFLQ
jgi:hypothetical protein